MQKDIYQVVMITAGSIKEAETMADTLVEERLAACVNIIPNLRSVYRWQGKIHHDDEVLMLVKTRRALLSTLQARVTGLHSYDLPEIIALDISGGLPAYFEFLSDNLTSE